MPEEIGRLLDVRTSSMRDRIAAMAPFHDAGWEVQLNFSPVIVTDDWLDRYDELSRQIDDTVPERVKRELACEVIFLTHNERLHEVNIGWHPTAEDYLWTPINQEAKVSQGGGHNVRYRTGYKGRMVHGHVCQTPVTGSHRTAWWRPGGTFDASLPYPRKDSLMFRAIRSVGITPDMFYFASIGSMLLSIMLWFVPRSGDDADKGRPERLAIFVGLWPPTLFLMGHALRAEAPTPEDVATLGAGSSI